MLTSTYIHIDNISYKTESQLWKCGYNKWWDVLRNPGNLPFNKSRNDDFERHIRKSIKKFMKDDIVFFTEKMEHKDYWRILGPYINETGFVDIETDINGEITVVGLFIGENYHYYTRGENIAKLEWMFSLPKAIVTFNGLIFDIPVIKKEFPFIDIPILHFDLLRASSQADWKGSLKKLEKQENIPRPNRIKNFTGYDAVKLWNKYIDGNKIALEILIEYNMYDVKNLKLLLEKYFIILKDKTLS